MYIVCVPAYGRDYKTIKSMLVDWNADKDFLVQNLMSKWNGKYFNKAQSEEMKKEGITHIQVRFDKCRKIEIIKL